MAKKPTESKRADGGRFTDTRRVKELVELMTANGLTEIELAEDKSRIVLRRGSTSQTSTAPHAPMPMSAPIHAPAAAPAPAPAAEEKLIPIKSPMIGTFYSAAGPDSPAYVSVGAPVDDKTVVCIIEAMKVFNQIPAGVSGTIARVLVANGQAVDFDTEMFLVKPA